MPKYKTQTNDLTEVIETGGGGGKLYVHQVKIKSNIFVAMNKRLFSEINFSVISKSETVLTLYEYAQLFNNYEYIQANYVNEIVSPPPSVENTLLINEFNVYRENNLIAIKVSYIDLTNNAYDYNYFRPGRDGAQNYTLTANIRPLG